MTHHFHARCCIRHKGVRKADRGCCKAAAVYMSAVTEQNMHHIYKKVSDNTGRKHGAVKAQWLMLCSCLRAVRLPVGSLDCMLLGAQR
jgi:hypothetical protein